MMLHLDEEDEEHRGDELAGLLQVVGLQVVVDAGAEDALVQRVEHLGHQHANGCEHSHARKGQKNEGGNERRGKCLVR